MACRAKHHWTTTLLTATIARNDASVLGGCPAYAEYTALVPSLRTGGMDTAGTCGAYRALRAAVSASIGCPGGRKSLPAQTTRPVPGAPYQTPACYRYHPPRLGLARALVRLASGISHCATGDLYPLASAGLSALLALEVWAWTPPDPSRPSSPHPPDGSGGPIVG